MKRKSFSAKKEKIDREVYVVDAKGKILGRIASKVANILRGKHKVTFTPHVDCGDLVVVTNASQLKVTGGKEKKKLYFTHSGYPHGHKLLELNEVARRNPTRVLKLAIKGMLPKGALGSQIIKNLVIHAGPADIAGKTLVI